jgi:hypothetical protein
MSATEHAAVEEPERQGSATGRVGRLSRGVRRVLRTNLLAVRKTRRERDDAFTAAREASATAEETTLEYETEKHKLDPNDQRPGRLPLAILTATGTALLDTLPAFWTAQALNRSPRETVFLTFLFVALLTALSSLLSVFTHLGWRVSRLITFVLAAAGIVLATGLRYDFVRVVNGDSRLRAALEAGVLALFSVVLIWVGYLVLVRAEPRKLFQLRAASEAAESEAGERARAFNDAEIAYSLAGEALQQVFINRQGEPDELLRNVDQELKEVAVERAKRLAVVHGGAEGTE